MSFSNYLLSFQRQLLDQVALAAKELGSGANSRGVLLLGDSGSGKSTALDILQKGFTPTVIDGQRVTPMCRIRVSAKGDATSILAEGLRHLGKPPNRPGDMKLHSLESNFEMALRAHRTRLLALEEAHNALLSGSHNFRGQTARLIKNIWNGAPSNSAGSWAQPDLNRGDWRVIFVLSGTFELLPVIKNDPELWSRFPISVEAPRLWFEPPALFKEFREVFAVLLARFSLVVHCHENLGELAVRALLACDGHLRILEDLLRRSATLYSGASESPPLMEALGASFDSVLGRRLSGNPFRYSAAELQERYAEAKRRSPVTAMTSNRKKKVGS